MQRWISRRGLPHMVAFLLASVLVLLTVSPAQAAESGEPYRNPLPLQIPGDGLVESCADPSVIYGAEGEGKWFMYCTADPLNDEDRNDSGGFNFRIIPMFESTDLVNWTYRGDALTSRPSYATANAGLWAPEIEYYRETGMYHMYYTVTETNFEGGGSAIGVAYSDTPLGPWTPVNTPAVEPHPADCCPGSRRWVFDPEVIRTNGADYIYYGSYFGGISVRVLDENGLTSVPATQKNVAVANKFEGPEVIFRNGYYYLFLSVTDCCRGPLTGYSVFVGRSDNPTGPFLDRDGVDLNDDERMDDATNAVVGGTPFLTMNGNRWVGPGHNTVFQDFDGQWWTIYHAIDRNDPYFEGGVNIFGGGCGAEEAPAEPDRCGDLNKRPALLDPIVWYNGWPTVNGGNGPSDNRQNGPSAQPGVDTKYKTKPVRQDVPAKLIFGDEFSNQNLNRNWMWVREPAAGSYGLTGKTFRFDAQKADLFVNNNSASVLTWEAPNGNYIAETRVKLDVPDEGCCFNFTQAGLVVYGDDNNYIKLAVASIFNTQQTEFAKELSPVQAGYPRYGNTVVGAPGEEWTYLRIAKQRRGGEELYTAYTKREGGRWTRGGTWTHNLGDDVRIGLVSMAEPGDREFIAEFDYVRVYHIK